MFHSYTQWVLSVALLMTLYKEGSIVILILPAPQQVLNRPFAKSPLLISQDCKTQILKWSTCQQQ